MTYILPFEDINTSTNREAGKKKEKPSLIYIAKNEEEENPRGLYWQKKQRNGQTVGKRWSWRIR
jgi:hypothetical protein